jgi:hypothetical protein
MMGFTLSVKLTVAFFYLLSLRKSHVGAGNKTVVYHPEIDIDEEYLPSLIILYFLQ